METLQSIWHVLSTPGTELLQEQKHNLIQSVSNNIDAIALLIALICLLLSVFGSKTAKKNVYWTIVLYFFAKVAILSL
jgi:hypothetical protein